MPNIKKNKKGGRVYKGNSSKGQARGLLGGYHGTDGDEQLNINFVWPSNH